jgi:hypothetical protein
MAITREELVGNYSGELPFPEREERGNGGGDDADRWVPPVGEGKREGWVPVWVRLVGLWARSGAGPKRLPGVQIYFYFSFLLFFFCFLKSFIHFSNLIQIDPNQLCKVSKIQNNHTEQ